MGIKLLILGAGQYGSVAKEIAEEMGVFEKIDFLDDKNPIAIGRVDACADYVGTYTHAFVAIGDPAIRGSLLRRVEEVGFVTATLQSPRAWVSPSASVGAGSAIEPMATVQANATVGKGCVITSGAVLRHNCTVGDLVKCDCNCVVFSTACVPAQTTVACGEIYR